MANELIAGSGLQLPSFTSMSWLPMVLIGVVIAALGSLALYLYIENKKYNKRIELFKIVNGRPVRIGFDQGFFEKLGRAGDYWFRTRAFKKILPRPNIEIAKNTYWYWEREDGEWINFGMANIDAIQKQAKIKYIDEDMRLQRLGIERNLEDRLKKQSFWDKYGNIIVNLIFFLMVTICLVVLFSQLGKLFERQQLLVDAINRLAVTMESIKCSATNGFVPTNATGI